MAAHPDRPRAGWQAPLKASAGIVVCRPGARGGLEALLVCKRYTHAFSEFVHGRYGASSRAPEAFARSLLALLGRMTGEELLAVRSLRFELLWYRIWLDNGNAEAYLRRREAFEAAFLAPDRGAALVALVDQARESGACLWEAPKGRPLSRREADVFCAVREVREETGLLKDDYRLIPGARLEFRYLSGGVRYVRAYFVALARPHLAASPGRGRPAVRPGGGAAEVGAVRWMGIEAVRAVDGPHRFLEAVVGPAFRVAKKFLRGRWACRPETSHLLAPGLSLGPLPRRAPPPPAPLAPAGGEWERAREPEREREREHEREHERGREAAGPRQARRGRGGIASADWRSPPP